MRTSSTQFEMMVDFMQRNGDLAKPGGGPRGRQWATNKWRELAEKLYSDHRGMPIGGKVAKGLDRPQKQHKKEGSKAESVNEQYRWWSGFEANPDYKRECVMKF